MTILCRTKAQGFQLSRKLLRLHRSYFDRLPQHGETPCFTMFYPCAQLQLPPLWKASKLPEEKEVCQLLEAVQTACSLAALVELAWNQPKETKDGDNQRENALSPNTMA